MNVGAVSHIAIGVRDMERSLHFYRDLLGLEVVMDTMHVQQDHRGLLENPERAQRRAVYLRRERTPHAPWIVLSQPVGESTGQAIKMEDVGIHHVALWEKNIRDVYARLEAENVPVVLPLSASEPGGASEQLTGIAKSLTTIVQDPDGILIQLDELVE